MSGDRRTLEEAPGPVARPLRVLCAPNAFKGTLSAPAAAAALAAGVRDGRAEATLVPMADGGDGTLDTLLAGSGSARCDRRPVHGPLGGRLLARLGWLDSTTAVVELAEAAGLRRLQGRRDPLRASSRGAGDLIRHALDGGASRILVGIGGSACSDGGAGLLAALGARLLDALGRRIADGGGALVNLGRADLGGLDPRLRGCSVEVATDVNSPLLGERGAAAVFGPQKGASALQVARLEAGLRRLAEVLERDAGVAPGLRNLPGAGAAGGSGYGLAAAGARLVPGAALVAEAVGIDRAIAAVDLVLTGEGRLDAQTGAGKAPIEVARRAGRLGVPCIAVAGVVELVPAGFHHAVALSDIARPGEDPERVPRRLLRRAGALIVRAAVRGG